MNSKEKNADVFSSVFEDTSQQVYLRENGIFKSTHATSSTRKVRY